MIILVCMTIRDIVHYQDGGTISLVLKFDNFQFFKELKIYVHKYSSNIRSKANFALLSKQLLKPSQTDTSVQPPVSVMNILVERLKESHSNQYDAFDIHLMIWATDIQSKPSQLYDELILRGPPVSLIHLFKSRLVLLT